jgi:hypothetical protein
MNAYALAGTIVALFHYACLMILALIVGHLELLLAWQEHRSGQ